LAGVLVVLVTGTAIGAEVVGGDEIYVLPTGEVISDDLYVTAGQVLIEGTVEGDLVAAGGFVEVSGVIMGDVFAAGGGVVISGVVQDDARLAGGGILVSGSIGDDLFAAGGGGPGLGLMPWAPWTVEGRSVPQGVQVAGGATIGGDSYLAGGSGSLAGSVGGDLYAAMRTFTFSGQVAGDASLTADNLTISPNSRVQGTLHYSTDEALTVPAEVAASVDAEPWADDAARTARSSLRSFLWWMVRTALIVVGLGLLGWLLLALAPNSLRRPVQALETEPVESGIYGMMVAVLVVPLSAALVFLAGLFWGWFPGGVVTFAFLFGLFGLIWLISPVITGLWLGRKLFDLLGWRGGDLPALLTGIALIVLTARVLGQIPCAGALVYLVLYLLSFALAVGAWIVARRQSERATGVQPLSEIA
jgi:cytoskeletal protein CcmA (bactofilin family)